MLRLLKLSIKCISYRIWNILFINWIIAQHLRGGVTRKIVKFEQILSVMLKLVQATFALANLSISGIYQLLLTQFWQNLKRRFLGLSWTEFNCSSNICRGNICPGNICPYQEYISCYWPDFDPTLRVGSWDYLEQILNIAVTFVLATFVLVAFVHIRNISAVTNPILTKL